MVELAKQVIEVVKLQIKVNGSLLQSTMVTLYALPFIDAATQIYYVKASSRFYPSIYLIEID